MSARDRQPVFDDFERDDPSPQRNGESSFAFYQRIAGDYWTQTRMLQQEWADHIENDTDYASVRGGLRSADDAESRSAFLELYLHEVLIRGGSHVVVHPALDHTSRRPDFLAQRASTDLYVEATAPSPTKAEKTAAGRMARLLAAVDQVNDPRFFLWTREINPGFDSPSGAKLRADLRRWLRDLDPLAFSPDSMPTYDWTQGGWSGQVGAWPTNPDSSPTRNRSIGVYGHHPVQTVDDASKIRRALAEKVRAYGRLTSPFVIVIGMHIFDSDYSESTNALYGQHSISVTFSGEGETHSQPFRAADGFFGRPGAWRNTRVSGVLIVNQLSPHDPTRADVSFWVHPGATHRMPESPYFPGSIRELVGDRVESRLGLDARRLLNLAEDWPTGEPWPKTGF